MSDNIKLPPYPEGLCLREDIEDYAREAVRLNAQAVPDGVIKRAIEALTYCEALNRNIEQQKLRSLNELHNILSAAPAAPQPAQPAQQDAKPIYQYQLATGGWIDQTRDSYEYNKANGVKGLRIVYEAAPQPAQQPVQQPLTDEKDAMLRQALEALEGFANITNDSRGVAGYHLNGDIAEWDEFDEVDAASSTIEAIRNHLGVKND